MNDINMKHKKYQFYSPTNSLNLSKFKTYLNPSTPKQDIYPINIYNFNYLSKQPSSFINVFCHFRPLNELELLYSKNPAVKVKSSKHLLLNSENPSKFPQEFIFDEIFEPNMHISSFYNKTCKNIVKYSMQGFNGGIIIYGESGSGKTYIIKEIIPKIIKQLYEEIGISDLENEIFKIEIGMFEIYKEQINDLLEMNNINLNLNELKNKKVIINNLTYEEINNEEELNNAINKGLNNKIKNSNNIKSHLIIELKIYRYYRAYNIMKYAKLYIAELEGIECCSNESDISEEQKVINKSIDALKMVVKRLNDRNEQDEDKIHIPYRNSKLTRILSDCFGGNSFTSFILTCSKSEYHMNQTKNILIFGENVRKIKNKPLINVEVNANKNSIFNSLFKDIIVNDNKTRFREINNLKQINKRYQEKIDQNQIEIEELDDTMERFKYNNKNNIKSNNEYNHNISKENKELNDKALYLTKKLSEEIATNQKISENNTILKNFTKTVINDLLSDKNYYLQQIENYKKKIQELKLLLKEKENNIQELNSDLNDKRSEGLLLQLEKDKILKRLEDQLSEKDEKIQNMEDNISDERKRMENNLYSQIKNSEAIIRELREEKAQSDSAILKYKKNAEMMNLKINDLERDHKKIVDDKENIINDLELKISNYKIKISQLTNDIFLKDSTIKKINGELEILKSELSNVKNNNDNLLKKNKILNDKNNEMNLSYEEYQKYISSMKSKEDEDKKTIDNYSSKIKDLQSELNIIKLKQNNDDNLVNHKLLKIKDLESQLKENNKIIDEYKNKFNLINKELIETKNIILNLNKEKEILIKENEEFKKNSKALILKDKEIFILNENKEKIEIKNKNQERELNLLKKMIQNIKTENESLKQKMNNYEEIKLELECLKNLGKNYTYIEINKSSLKQNYDKLMEENKQLKETLMQKNNI